MLFAKASVLLKAEMSLSLPVPLQFRTPDSEVHPEILKKYSLKNSHSGD